jgi:signal peptidase I
LCAHGGSGNSHSGRGAYFDAVESGFSCGTATPESTADPAQAVVSAQREVDEFVKLTPPTEIASAHRELMAADQAWLDVLRQLDGATPPPRDTTTVDKARALTTAEANWQEAFDSHYGVVLFRNEGVSMEPAFHSGDVLAVTPFSGEAFSRWQIIVFNFPLDQSRRFIKRIVGLPGETISSKGDTVYIDGRPLKEPWLPALSGNCSEPALGIPRQTVPPASYFVMGDCRGDSADSRSWGTLPASLIVGKVIVIVWRFGHPYLHWF